MDKEQKTLKSPLSAKCCSKCGEPSTAMLKLGLELKAKVAGEAQKSMARQLYSSIEYAIMRARQAQENQIAFEAKLIEIKKFLHDFLEKSL